MVLLNYFVLILFVLCTLPGGQQALTADRKTRETNERKYFPNWDSLDSRPLPTWFSDAKFGILIHWGVYSVPSFGEEWFWYRWQEGIAEYRDFMKKMYPDPNFTYQDFAHEFTAKLFNPTQWSELFQATGAKYVLLTSKHGDGYALWPSKYSFSWNSMDIGPHKDLIGELAAAIRKTTNLKFGLYHSLEDWYHPQYLADKNNSFTTRTFVEQKVLPELYELVENYKPEILYVHGYGKATEAYWKPKEFFTWLYNESPVKDIIVVNDRWGTDVVCRHGDFYSCNRYEPQSHIFMNYMKIDRKSSSFRRNAVLSEYYTLSELIKELVAAVSCGGSMVLNVGPTKDGTISPIDEERLRGVGDWLKINGEAIFGTKPWTEEKDSLTRSVRYTQNNNTNEIYAIILEWPKNDLVRLRSLKANDDTQISLLGSNASVMWIQEKDKLIIPLYHLSGELHKGQPAWVLKINNTENAVDEQAV